MAFTTIQDLNRTLGLTDGSQNSALEHFLARAVAVIRAKTRRFQGGIIQSITKESPTVVKSIGHGLTTGDVIKITGSDSTPSLDGTQTVTVVDRDSFTVAVAVTVAGSCGSYGKRFTEFYNGRGANDLFLRDLPVQEIESVWLDNGAYYGDASSAFENADLLVEGTDYALEHDGSGISRTGRLMRINNVWPGRLTRSSGLTQAGFANAQGNIKVQYIAGNLDIPMEVRMAAETFVAELQRTASRGGAMQQESLDYYSYTRMNPADESKAWSSVRSMLSQHTTWVF